MKLKNITIQSGIWKMSLKYQGNVTAKCNKEKEICNTILDKITFTED